MNKTTIPLFNDYLKIFYKKSTDSMVVMACLARNGFEYGCCSDSIIHNKTGLSNGCIQSSFFRLRDQRIFVEGDKIGKERYGKIDINDNFPQKYLPLLLSNTTVHSNSFKGIIKEIDKTVSRIILEGENNHKYIALCLNNKSIVFCTPIGTSIRFRGSLINQDTNTIVWMDERSVEFCDT
jgi:hypothetical protein